MADPLYSKICMAGGPGRHKRQHEEKEVERGGTGRNSKQA